MWASIEQIASDERYSLAIGPFGSNLKVPDYRDFGVPLVFVRNIRSGKYGGEHTKYVNPEKAIELSAHSVAAGDVLVTKMGEPPGDADVYPADQPSAIITADCIFLDDHLGLDPDEGIESVLFVLRQPPWKSKAANGDPRFWNARGVVRDFLSRLYDIALAPVDISRQVPTSIWNKTRLQFKYLYVKDIAALRRLVGNQSPAQFFRDLESTYVSELIEEVRIRVRLKKNDGSVTFRELSEGEQQLLTVLGLLRFTAEDESLFLLDEPDTHLNPRWSVDYISYLKQFIANGTRQEETSHILLTTHNPLAIAELEPSRQMT